MSESVGQIALDLEVNQNGFNSQLNNIASTAQSSLGGAFLKLGGIIGTAFAVTKLVEFGKSSIELASNLNEVQNVVDKTFGSMSSQIDAFSKNTITQFGMSELSAKKYASTMGAMLKSSGITGQPLVEMSEKITGLSGDMASFYNLSQDDAFQKIRAGISGETEPLKQLGVNMSVANLEAYALSQGIKTSYQHMNQASQTLLRYNYLLSVTKDAQGDFAGTAHSWANEVRTMSEQWNIFKTTMGQGFINMLTPVLSGLNVLIAKLQVAAQYFKAFTEMMFGAQNATSNTSGTDAATTASDKLGNSVKNTAAAIKNSTSAFDQLNVIGSTSSSSGDATSSTGDSAVTTPAIATTAPDTSGIVASLKPLKEALDNLLKPLQSIDFTPLTTALGTLKTALEPFVSTLFEGLHWAYLNIFVPLSKFYVENFLPAWLDVLSGALKVLNPLLEVFKPFGLFLWNEFLKPIAEWTGGVIIKILQDLAKGLNSLGDWVSSHKDTINNFLLGVEDILGKLKGAALNLWNNVLVPFGDFLKNVFVAAWEGITTAATWLWKNVLAPLGDFLLWIWNSVLVPLGGILVDVLAVAFKAVSDVAKVLWKDVFVPLGEFFTATFSPAVEAVKTVFNFLWNDVLKPFGTFLENAFKAAWTVIVDVLKLLWNDVLKPLATYLEEGFMNIFNTVMGTVKIVIKETQDVFIGIMDFITGVFSGNWSKAWTGIKEVFKGIFDALVGIAKTPVNAVVDMLNALINHMNTLKITIPPVVVAGKVLWEGFTVGMPQLGTIPKLANGGLVSAPTLAMVGDNRGASTDPEVISPLSKLKSMMGNGNNEDIIKVLMMILQAIEDKSVSLEMDGVKLTKLIREHLTTENNRIGKRSVSVGGVFV